MSVMRSAPASIAIRVDGGTQIGSGHVMRCLCLAGELARSGGHVAFLCRDLPGNLSARIEREGYPVVRFGDSPVPWTQDCDETREFLERARPSWLIVDHYGLAADWERAVRTSTTRLLAIDDLADRPHECDVLLDQNYLGPDTLTRYSGLVPSHCRQMLGPRYALLQREYANLGPAVVPRAGDVRRVLVFFGGTDATNETGKALRALARPELLHLAVDVVLGANHPAPEEVAALALERPGTTLHRSLPTLAGLMFRADLAIGAGGTTTSERMCMRLPSVVITVAANQERPIASLAEEGAVMWAGRAGSVTVAELSAIILRAVRKSPTVPPMVDGHGAARASAVILPPPVSKLRLNRATSADAGLLFDWRNEATTRDMSFDGTPIAWDSHLRWFEERLADRDTQIFVGEVDGLPVGQARLESRGEETVLSYSIDPDLRGLGFGAALVEEAVRRVRRPPAGGFRAHVKAHNEFSKRIFRSLGWHETIEGTEHIYRISGSDL
jgi:UDP-2,4-diacetamido-2,4,6-trideoxy-beta-L-altropyranose hydrolase